ncbi:uncharacterized protein CIMG_13007 [Coccidioides immitis RS]|uniref:Uncharacterized protein n=1 Tax=Coccidioides immitis (strain RS) TaxID=246410 RepID=J3K763_COCIM|nr:uncharacterized protein CIMG_13007 [Coccidioides immitis RS]EAS30500.3 hypothetical protein CIMG_13007 [Coccidioides immitis RS]
MRKQAQKGAWQGAQIFRLRESEDRCKEARFWITWTQKPPSLLKNPAKIPWRLKFEFENAVPLGRISQQDAKKPRKATILTLKSLLKVCKRANQNRRATVATSPLLANLRSASERRYWSAGWLGISTVRRRNIRSGRGCWPISVRAFGVSHAVVACTTGSYAHTRQHPRQHSSSLVARRITGSQIKDPIPLLKRYARLFGREVDCVKRGVRVLVDPNLVYLVCVALSHSNPRTDPNLTNWSLPTPRNGPCCQCSQVKLMNGVLHM